MVNAVQSSGTSSSAIIVNRLPSASAALIRWIIPSVSPPRVQRIEVPTIMSTSSCSVSVRTFGESAPYTASSSGASIGIATRAHRRCFIAISRSG